MTAPIPQESPFDFNTHRIAAEDVFRRRRPLYQEFARVVRSILTTALEHSEIQAASVEARAKDIDSFGKKAAKASESYPEQPKYPDPLVDITDLAGARVITFFPRAVELVDALVHREFAVLEKTDKSAELRQEDKFGYQSVHYLLQLTAGRLALPEYARFAGLVVELQVRTILQHAWAEIEHDIQYKSAAVIPEAIRRRFTALAGLLEIADREFQAVQDEDQKLRLEARLSVDEGRLDEVEITPDALRAYLDNKLGPDGRMTVGNYEFWADQLRRMGFTTLSQVDACSEGQDGDAICRIVWGRRQGQLSRFDYMLMASMGDVFTERFFLSNEPWWLNWRRDMLDQLRAAGVEIGSFDPLQR